MNTGVIPPTDSTCSCSLVSWLALSDSLSSSSLPSLSSLSLEESDDPNTNEYIIKYTHTHTRTRTHTKLEMSINFSSSNVLMQYCQVTNIIHIICHYYHNQPVFILGAPLLGTGGGGSSGIRANLYSNTSYNRHTMRQAGSEIVGNIPVICVPLAPHRALEDCTCSSW